ncbi:MAG: competence/damage-inducible protein A [Gammaproteobacteria bacterium]|nr:competence/damage-inducible protein A [Gammaproteobacteria bacterium]
MTEPAPTASVLLIGNELLSGRTRDANLQYIGDRLSTRGIKISGAHIIPDIPDVIISTLNYLRSQNTYLFTTGGIGPTHDDITADCVAEAFGVELPIHAEAEALLLSYFQARGIEPNEDRMRMARIPTGATLIDNPVSAAPGFRIDNVFVMAGVPKIMQQMFDSILPTLARGPEINSVSVACDLGEGTIAAGLRSLQAEFPDIDIGSYPGAVTEKHKVSLVARGTEPQRLRILEERLKELVTSLGGSTV